MVSKKSVEKKLSSSDKTTDQGTLKRGRVGYTALLLCLILGALALRYFSPAVASGVSVLKGGFTKVRSKYFPSGPAVASEKASGATNKPSSDVTDLPAVQHVDDLAESLENEEFMNRVSESLKESAGVGNKEVVQSIDALKDVVTKNYLCVLGMQVLQRIKDRIDSGLDFRLEINLLRKNFPFVEEFAPSLDYDSIRSRYYVLSRLRSLTGGCEQSPGGCMGASLKGEDVCSGISKVRCFLLSLRRYFGVRSVMSERDAEFIKTLASYDMSYKSLLLALQASGLVVEPELFADIDKVLLVLSKVDDIEDRLLAQCM